MNLDELKPGKLLKLNDSNLACWFSNSYSRSNVMRLKVGSKESFELESKNQKNYSNSFIVYLGLGFDYRSKNIIRQMRLIYIDGTVGYIECYDFKYLINLD